MWEPSCGTQSGTRCAEAPGAPELEGGNIESVGVHRVGDVGHVGLHTLHSLRYNFEGDLVMADCPCNLQIGVHLGVRLNLRQGHVNTIAVTNLLQVNEAWPLRRHVRELIQGILRQ